MSVSTQPRSPLPGYALFGLAFLGAICLFASAISQLYAIWSDQPEYSYGILIPALSVFLIWRGRAALRGLPFTGSWYGLALIVVGLALRMIGTLATMPTLVHYALLVVLYGLVLSFTGPAIFRRLVMPLFILVFMVPLPPGLSQALSAQLQLISSQIGAQVIRALGISVYLSGNIIDLGNYQLEVAEACSGLRYLFPLMTLSFMIAYAFGGAFWKRALVFLSSIPITVLMNSLRIGVIAVTVDQWGIQMAEGVLHEFEGWVVFMASAILVVFLARTLQKIGRPNVAKAAATADPAPKAAATVAGLRMDSLSLPFREMPRSFIVATAIVAVGVAAEFAVPERPEIPPARPIFTTFPMSLGAWVGTAETLEPVYLQALQLDDYLLMNYREAGGTPVNLYVAYYKSQRTGMSVHSPKLCLPGDGWEVQSFDRYPLPRNQGRAPLPVNRVIIEKGGQRELVYYWFMERGRRLTNEYTVRWYLFWDALVMNRTDGALVRMVAPIPKGGTEADADRVLQRFFNNSEDSLNHYIPD